MIGQCGRGNQLKLLSRSGGRDGGARHGSSKENGQKQSFNCLRVKSQHDVCKVEAGNVLISRARSTAQHGMA